MGAILSLFGNVNVALDSSSSTPPNPGLPFGARPRIAFLKTPMPISESIVFFSGLVVEKWDDERATKPSEVSKGKARGRRGVAKGRNWREGERREGERGERGVSWKIIRGL